MANKFGFNLVLQNVQKMKTELPLVLANTTKNHFLNQNFKKAQFDGQSWPAVKRYGKPGSKRNNSAPLVQTGKLRRAIANSLKSATFNLIEFRVTESTGTKGFNYGAIHNYGLPMKNGQPMPKRQFIGQDKALVEVQLKKIKTYSDRLFKVK